MNHTVHSKCTILVSSCLNEERLTKFQFAGSREPSAFHTDIRRLPVAICQQQEMGTRKSPMGTGRITERCAGYPPESGHPDAPDLGAQTLVVPCQCLDLCNAQTFVMSRSWPDFGNTLTLVILRDSSGAQNLAAPRPWWRPDGCAQKSSSVNLTGKDSFFWNFFLLTHIGQRTTASSQEDAEPISVRIQHLRSQIRIPIRLIGQTTIRLAK